MWLYIRSGNNMFQISYLFPNWQILVVLSVGLMSKLGLQISGRQYVRKITLFRIRANLIYIHTIDLNDRPGFKLEYKAISGKFVQNASYVGICDQMLTLLEI